MQYRPWMVGGKGYSEEKIPDFQTNDGLTLPSGGLGFLSSDECAATLDLRNLVTPRHAITGNGVGGRSMNERTSTVWEVYPGPETEWLFNKLEVALMKLNEQWKFDLYGFLEGAQIYEYPIGGFLNWHRDVGMGYMSARKLSMTLQLSHSTDYDGGDLEFMDFQEKAPRGRGDLTVFPSFLMHRVTSVTRGMRLCCVSWVHGPPFR